MRGGLVFSGVILGLQFGFALRDLHPLIELVDLLLQRLDLVPQQLNLIAGCLNVGRLRLQIHRSDCQQRPQ